MEYAELAHAVIPSLAGGAGLSDAAHAAAVEAALAREAAAPATLGWSLAVGVALGQWGRLRELARDVGDRGLRSPSSSPALSELRLVAFAFAIGEALRWALARALGDVPAGAPLPAGLGLAAVGAALVASTQLRAHGRQAHPWLGPLVLGVAQGIALFPGASLLGLGIVAAALLGLGGRRGVDLALLAALPHLFLAAWRGGPPPPLPLFAGCVAGSWAGVVALRRLADRDRLAWIGTWGAAVGAALIAYGRAV